MMVRVIAWGARVSKEFIARVCEISDELGCNPDHLMACMAFESCETFSPSIRNAAGSGAVGLIQFMPSTARLLGTTTEKLAVMTAEEQLSYVAKYFSGLKGRLKSVEDLYMAILWPVAVGKPLDYVLFKGPDGATYRQNRGLDLNHDGSVTKAEAAAGPKAKLAKGLLPENAGC